MTVSLTWSMLPVVSRTMGESKWLMAINLAGSAASTLGWQFVPAGLRGLGDDVVGVLHHRNSAGNQVPAVLVLCYISEGATRLLECSESSLHGLDSDTEALCNRCERVSL